MRKAEIELLNRGASTEIVRDGYTLDNKGITQWLVLKGIITIEEELIYYKDRSIWKRSGGETYSCSFELLTNKNKKHIFIKALIGLFPDKILKTWARRRQILSENGVSVANWYDFSEATIIEDFYPKIAKDFVSFDEILSIAYKIDNLGFVTLKFLDDVRADDYGRPYFVDFGFDLGEPSKVKVFNARNYLIRQYPEKAEEIKAFFE